MISGTTASLRPLGIGRYFSAAFLSVWLVGWVIVVRALISWIPGPWNDSGEVVDLGHWLARRTGFPLKLAGMFGPRQSAAERSRLIH